MFLFILIALLNGIMITSARIINAQLGEHVGIFKASFWNHLVGFLFLALIILPISSSSFTVEKSLPLVLYIGGIIGVFFVAINNYVLPKIGSSKTVILVVSGQMLSAVIIDSIHSNLSKTLLQFFGVSFIIYAIYKTHTSKKNIDKK